MRYITIAVFDSVQFITIPVMLQ